MQTSVTVVAPNENISNMMLVPLVRNATALRSHGIALRICQPPVHVQLSKYYSTDILILNSKLFRPFWKRDSEQVLDYLAQQRRYCSKILWFDDTDSTGTTQFQVLPFVDAYLKKQLAWDMKRYSVRWDGDREFTHYYVNKDGVKLPYAFESQLLSQSDIGKIGLSWNIGLGDMYGQISNRIIRWARKAGKKWYSIRWHDVGHERAMDVQFRGTLHYGNSAVDYQRQIIAECLRGLEGFKRNELGYVSRGVYQREMRGSKSVVSPFGWGEIGVRDFATWMAGSCLIKPHLYHVRTWPCSFVPYETYLPLEWGRADLCSQLPLLLRDEALMREIANGGQTRYKQTVGEIGMAEFRSHFVNILEDRLIRRAIDDDNPPPAESPSMKFIAKNICPHPVQDKH